MRCPGYGACARRAFRWDRELALLRETSAERAATVQPPGSGGEAEIGCCLIGLTCAADGQMGKIIPAGAVRRISLVRLARFRVSVTHLRQIRRLGGWYSAAGRRDQQFSTISYIAYNGGFTAFCVTAITSVDVLRCLVFVGVAQRGVSRGVARR
jgi:hypothetical protein